MKRYILFIIIILLSGCDKLSNDKADDDNDGIVNSIDNCIDEYNSDQKDTDGDGIGDVCDPDNYDGPLGDPDEDGVYNRDDNCPEVYNPDQNDDDNDGIGNLCDSDWVDPNGDLDGDGVINSIDNCLNDYNPDQADGDGDYIGDSCDSDLEDGPTGDKDGDGIPNNQDSCPNDYNKGTDYDNDGIDDACDPPPPEYALTFGLYDDFDGMGCEQTYDGSQMAVDGSLSSVIWRHLASEDVSVVDLTSIIDDSVSYGANPSGNVVRLNHTDRGDIRLEVINPMKIDFADYQSFSADMMIDSNSISEDYSGGLDFHTSIPEQGGASWYCGIGLKEDNTWGKKYIVANLRNKNNDYQTFEALSFIEENIWFNLRMDITKLNDTEMRVDFFVNDTLKYSEIPPDSEILLDPSRLLFGPIRSITMYKKESDGDAFMFIDNVKTTYKNRTQ